jgi:hypothetical protein
MRLAPVGLCDPWPPKCPRDAAQATGILPLNYMLAVMRDPAADHKRRDAMAMAAAPYLHARLSTIDATRPAVAEPSSETTSVVVEFVVPNGARTREDQE